jgi:Ran GTPase-activating protein (RanGAP) involved in mRNA processing and transport
MISQIDNFIKNIEKNEKIITYLKNIYKVEVGDDPIIPDAYIEGKINQVDAIENEKTDFATFEEKVIALNLPSINDKNIKLKITKMKKAKDTKFLIKSLDISNYGDRYFNHELFKRVIDGMKILKSVESINLKYNNMDDSYVDLVCELFNIENLKRIDLSFNNFTKFAAKKIINCLKNINKLEFFDVSYNPWCLDDLTCTNFSSCLKSHTNLFHFGLSDSSRDSAIRIMHTKPDLRSLNLDDSGYKPRAFETLARALADRKYSLAILSLKFCNIDIIASSYIEKALRQNKSLVCLNLHSTGLPDVGGGKIISALENNKYLTEIDLSCNKLADEFCIKFNKTLKLNVILNSANIAKNYLIKNENFEHILEGLINNQNIFTLGDLSDTRVGVKLRESAEKILNLNMKCIEYMDKGNISLRESQQGKVAMNEFIELNKSQKANFFKSSNDFQMKEKNKRENLDAHVMNSERSMEQDYNNEEKELILKYDIKFNEKDIVDNFEFFSN